VKSLSYYDESQNKNLEKNKVEINGNSFISPVKVNSLSYYNDPTNEIAE